MSGLNPWESVWDPTLPMLPGAVATPAMIEAYTRTINTATDVFERVIFAACVAEPTPAPEPTDYSGWSKAQLYARAKELNIPGRSKMLKSTLLREISKRTG
jgi:hypothetical protein